MMGLHMFKEIKRGDKNDNDRWFRWRSYESGKKKTENKNALMETASLGAEFKNVPAAMRKARTSGIESYSDKAQIIEKICVYILPSSIK